MVEMGHRPGLRHPLSLEIALALFGGTGAQIQEFPADFVRHYIIAPSQDF